MAKNKLTVFQTLERALKGNFNSEQGIQPHVNSYDMSGANSVIYRTKDKQDYEKAKLELQQNAYLKERWLKANIDLSVSAFAGLTNVKLMYRDADLMDSFPEIGAALDIVAEESCIFEDTKIKLLNGSVKTIKELYDNNYNDFWVYSVDDEGLCKPSLVERVIYKGIKPLYKITLDDGTEIKCTEDHKWFKSDFSWVETKDLKNGDSLMSIYDKLDYKGYEKIKSTIENDFSHTHRIVAENVLHSEKKKLSEINNPFQKIVIHHKSFNKLNNDPNELVYMFWDEHQKLHTDLNSERWKNEEFAKKMKTIFSETNSKLWKESSRAELREKLSMAQKERMSKMSSEERKSLFGKPGESNGMFGVHRYGSENPNYNSSKLHIENIDENEYVDYIINVTDIRKNVAEHFNLTTQAVILFNKYLCDKYNCKHIDGLKFRVPCKYHISEIKRAIREGNDSLTKVSKFLGITEVQIYNSLKYNGYKSFSEFKEHASNHTIINVEKIKETGKVYDLLNSSVNHCFAVKCNTGHIISHNCLNGDKGQIVNVYSKSERLKAILEDLFVNRLNLQVTAPMVIRGMCKYGNNFMMLDIDNKLGVKGWRQLPVFNVERLENGIQNPYGSGQSLAVNSKDYNPDDFATKFVWTDENNTQVPFRTWQIAHFRLLTNSLCLPYGTSYLNAARRHWRMLSLMEDMMLIYRLERSIERRVYKIYVGAIDDADVQAYVEQIANNFKRTPIIDPMTGQVDLRKNILSVDQDIFIPVRDQNAPTPIDTLSAAQNLTAMDDIKFVQNKVLTALRIPKSFLNFEENAGDGKNLALMDIRFTRVINRIQQAFLMELTKVASIHLYLLGFEDDLTNFNLTMNNPSTQAEQLEIDNLQKKISAVRDAVSDPGNGLPVMSQTRALKQIMKWSDKEIKENLEEIRLEKGLAAELEKTTQIIKRTGIFDIVDRMYGEPGAEYQEDMQQGGPDGGMGGGMGGGGGGFGGGLDDLGAPGADEQGDIQGAEGAEPTGDMEGGAPPEGEAPPGPPPSNESKLLNGKKLLSENTVKERNKVLDSMFEKYISKIDNRMERVKKPESIVERTDVYDKSLLINEEFSKMIDSLNMLVDEEETDE